MAGGTVAKVYQGGFMTKAEFKRLWDSGDDGGGITLDDIAECAKEWGLYHKPKTCQINKVFYDVLMAACVLDADKYKPEDV